MVVGDPACRRREAPGTVGTIGEDVASGAVRVQDFVACFGPPTLLAQGNAQPNELASDTALGRGGPASERVSARNSTGLPGFIRA